MSVMELYCMFSRVLERACYAAPTYPWLCFFPVWILPVFKQSWTGHCFPKLLTQISFLSSVSTVMFTRGQKVKDFIHCCAIRFLSTADQLSYGKLLIQHMIAFLSTVNSVVHVIERTMKGFPIAYTQGFSLVWVLLGHRKQLQPPKVFPCSLDTWCFYLSVSLCFTCFR